MKKNICKSNLEYSIPGFLSDRFRLLTVFDYFGIYSNKVTNIILLS